MSLIIDDADIEALVRLLAELTGESVEEAVAHAVQDRLDRVLPQRQQARVSLADLDQIVEEYNRRPLADPLPAEETLGYDDRGRLV